MSLSIGSPRSILFWMPSRPAISMAEKARYGLQVGVRASGTRCAWPSGCVRVHRDADAGRAVALRVDQVDRRLVAGHQPPVASSSSGRRRPAAPARASAGRRCTSAPISREARVAVLVEEQVRAVLPERLVHVHARAVVPEERLGHEGGGLAVLARPTFLTTYLYIITLVGHLEQRVEAHVDLGLAGGGHLVVVHLDRDARRSISVSTISERMSWSWSVGGHREVAFLVARPGSPGCGRRCRLPGVPDALVGVDEVEAVVAALVEADVVEDEELGLRPEVGGVGDAGRLAGTPRPSCAT